MTHSPALLDIVCVDDLPAEARAGMLSDDVARVLQVKYEYVVAFCGVPVTPEIATSVYPILTDYLFEDGAYFKLCPTYEEAVSECRKWGEAILEELEAFDEQTPHLIPRFETLLECLQLVITSRTEHASMTHLRMHLWTYRIASSLYHKENARAYIQMATAVENLRGYFSSDVEAASTLMREAHRIFERLIGLSLVPSPDPTPSPLPNG